MKIPISISLRFTQVSRKEGLRKLEVSLPQELHTGLTSAGKRLMRASRSLMRSSSGESQKSLQAVVHGSSMTLNLRVTTTLIQAYTDAYGLRRGVMPNSRVGSSLYHWVRRKVKGGWTGVVRDKSAVPRKRRVSKVKPVAKGQFELSKQRKVSPVDRKKNPSGFKEAQHIRRMTYFVARAIYKHGIAGSHWNRKALDRERANVRNDIRNAVRRAINKA